MHLFILAIIIIIVLKGVNEKTNTGYSKQKNNNTNAEQYPYRVKYVLTKTEYVFYKTLKIVCDKNDCLICPKVGLKDIVNITDKRNYMKYWGKINQKHIDFLICDSNLKPILAIELDDASHKKEKARKNDDFKNNLFMTIELPLKRVEVMPFYHEINMENMLSPYMTANRGKQPT